MGRFFSDPVERALKCIYCDLAAGRGQEGFQLLAQAVQNGDSDACCLLARCLYGPEYTWPGHNFPVDGRAGDELMRQSVLGGSAIGVLLSLRSGVMNRQLARSMPLTLQEAFDAVLDKAEHGEPFCQMLIGNVYFWGDFVQVLGKDRGDFDGDDAFQNYLRENYAKCEDWLWQAYRNGVSLAGLNLGNFYRNGKQGLIAPRPEQAREVNRYGAEKGYPDAMSFYADDLFLDDKNEEAALPFYRRSAELGEPRSFFMAGWSYEMGKGVEKDAHRAADYYERALAAPLRSKVGIAKRLGAFYFEGEGVERDYAKAFQLLKWDYDHNTNDNWGAYYLGACYAHGWGTQQDYVQARKFLEKINWNCSNGFYLLGYLYGRGLGGPEDIPKGVEYLQKAGNHADAKEELRRYKKTLFGKWVRR